MKTTKFARKTFYVDAVRVSEKNIEEVAAWCNGTIETDAQGVTCLRVKVYRPLNDRQSVAYVGDWVSEAGSGFKIYLPKAFDQSFEKVRTLTKEQADAAGIKVPHEPRPAHEKKAETGKPSPGSMPKKRSAPARKAGKSRRQHIGEVGKAMREAQAKLREPNPEEKIVKDQIQNPNVIVENDGVPINQPTAVGEGITTDPQAKLNGPVVKSTAGKLIDLDGNTAPATVEVVDDEARKQLEADALIAEVTAETER